MCFDIILVMDNYEQKIDECLNEFGSNKNGLTQDEAVERLSKNGKNELPQKKKTPNIVKFLKQFCDIMIIILLVAAVVSITMAVIQKTYSEMVDGFIILAIVFVNALIGYLQEIKAEKEMQALVKMSEPQSKVKRNGEIVKINSSDIVVGDIVILEAGDIVPADVRLIFSSSLKVDESSLTGESLLVEKDALKLCKAKTPLADRKNMAYKGSVVGLGRAEGLVVATGKDTELGKIATMLTESKKDITPLQKNIKSVGKVITIIVLVIAVITFLLEVIAKPNGSIITAFLTAVAISVAAIPESMPAVITIIMSMGVNRLSKQKAIVKRLHAVETLGSTEIICSDKTGTLTQNVMTVRKVFYNNELKTAEKFEDEMFVTLLKTMALCNDSEFSHDKYVGDPTETALTEYAQKCGLNKKQLEIENVRVDEIPFDSNRKLMTVINKQNGIFTAYTKGAPDIILKHCTKVLVNGVEVELNNELKNNIISANETMANSALRVLGCAIQNKVTLGEVKEENMTFVGLVGMMDPPREEVKDAVEKCKNAHMTPIMITGDHKDTAFAIAKEIGICSNKKQVMLGAELDELSDEEYKKIIYDIKVYARVSPENKVRIVKTYKSLGKVVAMTGDGVNDAPSLKNADIGVGMGITGTDVTKEVADMIVTDDNFATIVMAVKEGRRIYSNIIKTITFLFGANTAEILSLFLATILFPNLTFLMPVQILFVNLLTDTLPAIALGLEPPEGDLMTKSPRRANKSIFSGGVGLEIIFIGIVQTIAVLVAFYIGTVISSDPLIPSSMAFLTINVIQMAYLISMRTNTSFFKTNPFSNKWIWYSVLFSFGTLAIIEFTPVRNLLKVTNIGLVNWLIVFGIGLVVFALSEIIKLFIRKKGNKKLVKKQ